ncbi:MAG: AAA family ATPase [Acidimicrobiales bacterium]|nr:AAA family ATPase [Acidimicrobiales bacterium]
MELLERERQLATLADHAATAFGGSGALVLVCGEPGAGKTSFIDAFLADLEGRRGGTLRVLSAVCDPLSTPRPLGPVLDLAGQLGAAARTAIEESDHAHAIFTAVFDDLAAEPTVLVVDDLHWADQGTVDLLRFVLRRIGTTRSLVIGAVRDEELGLSHPMRGLLGDVARSADAESLRLPPLSLAAIETLTAGSDLDADRLLHLTGGNAFFVAEMLDHRGDDLPTTVRDAVLSRTAGLGVGAWDLLNLLTSAPEAIPDRLLPRLGATLPALRELDAAGLIRRGPRGVTFRHDLCRLAVSSVIPPGAGAALHVRMIDALEAVPGADPAVLVHHALGAGDGERILRYADLAGRAAARSGAHTQAAEFYRLALEQGAPTVAADRAHLLERLAAELYLTDQLGEAIASASAAMQLREDIGDVVGACIMHNALAVYEWYNADRAAAERHVEASIAALGGHPPEPGPASVTLGYAYAMQAFLAIHASRLDVADAGLARAAELGSATRDRVLAARAGLVGGALAVVRGDTSGRDEILSILAGAPAHLDEVYSGGYSHLCYLDVEQRHFDDATALLDRSIPLMVEHDLPICRVWQIGARGRLAMMRGHWDAALADADDVLAGNSAPLAQTWPHLVRGLVALRRTGDPGAELERAWDLAVRYDEAIRLLPAAAALAEQSWLTGVADPRVRQWQAMLGATPVAGLEWARGELAVWLRRLGDEVEVDGVAAPYAAILAGDHGAAVAAFEAMPLPYDVALAALDSGGEAAARRAVDILDRLGADAVAAKVRRDLRADGGVVVPARRRAATRGNPLGLTERQLEVLAAMSDGSTNAELAARLYISEKTVDHHVSAIIMKLAAENRRDAVRRARQRGIIT